MTDAPLTFLHAFIGNARWFGGKGRDFAVREVHRLPWLPAAGDDSGRPRARIELAVLGYLEPSAGAPDVEVYQLPLAYYRDRQDRLEHALVGEWDDEELGHCSVYDAVHDRDASALWLHAFDEEYTAGGLTFRRLPGHELDTDVHSTLFSGEQSNSSMAFGDDSLMKVFRKVTPGHNPDIEVHEALTLAENDNVASLYGWLEADGVDLPGVTGSGEPLQLAMLQQFLRTASDGWDLALASVRDLFAEGDLHADEVGGDFAAESHRLGAATAAVHLALAESFPTETVGPDRLADLAAGMRRRLDDALTVVSRLEPHADALYAAFDAVAALTDPVVVQRVHGDLHLGQTLRTVKGWKIVDFEGEPAKPLAERTRPDSPWRDVAGMLRSLDYAAHAVEADVEEGRQIAYRALEWVTRNQTAFLAGYAEGRGQDEEGGPSEDEVRLLRAYVLDKAVYETVYEARNRPTWIGIPLDAVARLLQTSAPTTETPEVSHG